MMSAPGELLGGRYSLEGLLARGGMADVFRARDVVLGREVAVKALRAGATDEADARRFERETLLLAGLGHPNLVRLLDAGRNDDGSFLVLELVEGPTLAQRLGRGPLGPAPAGQVGYGIARALAHVHARGVVHRDVKPSNILLALDGRALLSDFGVAQLADGTRFTATRATIGTAAYLAPEQIGGEGVTSAADVYALGLVLIEALAGRPSFAGTPVEMLTARLVRDPPIPAGVPPRWARLLRDMTRRDPASRPDAGTVATDLTALTALAPEDGGDDPVDLDDLLDARPGAAAGPATVAVPAPFGPATGAVPVRLGPAGVAMAARRGTHGAILGAALSTPSAGALDAPTRRAARTLATARISPLWLAALVPLTVLAGFVLAPGRGPGGEAAGSRPVVSASTSTGPTSVRPFTTAATTTTAPPTTVSPTPTPPTAGSPTPAPPTVDPARQVASAAQPPADGCAEIDAQRQAIDEERQQVDEAYRHDRATREALRDDLQHDKRALDDQWRARGC